MLSIASGQQRPDVLPEVYMPRYFKLCTGKDSDSKRVFTKDRGNSLLSPSPKHNLRTLLAKDATLIKDKERFIKEINKQWK